MTLEASFTSAVNKAEKGGKLTDAIKEKIDEAKKRLLKAVKKAE